MLDNYLEYNIQNKIKLFYILQSYKTINVSELNSLLYLSTGNINNLIEEINSDLKPHIEIYRNYASYSISISDDIEPLKIIHLLSHSSNVLKCLKFLITNDRQKPFSLFIDENFLTKSTAYRIRETCQKYLSSVGLDIKNNQVVGDETRIRFLIALLNYKYGVDCCNIDKVSIEIARKFILYTNQVIDMNFLEKTSTEYGYFENLLILSWKRKKYPLSFPKSSELERLKKIFIYDDIKQAVKPTIEKSLNINYNNDDLNYIYLAYCCTNSCVFSDKWTDEDILLVHKIVFSYKPFSNLLHDFGEKFGEKIQQQHALKVELIYFYKKCLFELQCIIPDKHYYLDSKKNSITLSVIQCVTVLLKEWVIKNNMNYQITENHIIYLSLKVESIIHQIIEPTKVLLVFDIISELRFVSSFIQRTFSSKRINIIPVHFNAEKMEALFQAENSIIITSKKFERALYSLGCNKTNTIIPISIEFTEQEVSTIESSLLQYEEKAFRELIESVKEKCNVS